MESVKCSSLPSNIACPTRICTCLYCNLIVSILVPLFTSLTVVPAVLISFFLSSISRLAISNILMLESCTQKQASMSIHCIPMMKPSHWLIETWVSFSDLLKRLGNLKQCSVTVVFLFIVDAHPSNCYFTLLLCFLSTHKLPLCIASVQFTKDC